MSIKTQQIKQSYNEFIGWHEMTGRSSTWNTELSNGLPPQCEVHRPHNNSPASRPTSPVRNLNVSSTAIDQDERVWGEILERSLSSGSLHHLHRLYGDHLDNGSSNIETTAASWNNKRPDTNWPVTPKSRPQIISRVQSSSLTGPQIEIQPEYCSMITSYLILLIMLIFEVCLDTLKH